MALAIRWIVAGIIASLLLLVTIKNPQKGIFVTFLWLPFMGFVRRLLYTFNPYTKYDPILLIGIVVCIFLIIKILTFHRMELLKLIKRDRLTRLLLMLLGIFTLQIFNPLQENLLVGIGGIIFYIIPVLWFFIGAVFAKREDVIKLLNLYIWIGVVVAIYGICQVYLGFRGFEKYWIQYGGYVSLQISGGVFRPFSTFVSVSEYTTFLNIVAAIALVKIIYERKPFYLILLLIFFWAGLIGGVRGFLFKLLAVIIVLFAIKLKEWKKMAIFLSFSLLVIIVVLSVVNYRPGLFIKIPKIGNALERQVAGVIDPFGTRSTLPIYFEGIRKDLNVAFIKNPFGYGLGSTTLAAKKFGKSSGGSEVDFINVFLATSILGGILYLSIIYLIFMNLWSHRFKNMLFICVFVIMLSSLGEIIGLAHYAIIPLFWMLIGWINKKT
ncbi:hypothetical protein KAW65_08455 [candidate division WOR-3 bacterium]|nr:hypothetical protein [candidate division WOR-3 bacterium]